MKMSLHSSLKELRNSEEKQETPDGQTPLEEIQEKGRIRATSPAMNARKLDTSDQNVQTPRNSTETINEIRRHF